MKKGNDLYLRSEGKNIHVVCCDENDFPWGKFKLFSIFFFHSVYLVFSIRLVSFANLFAVHYLWDVCNKDKCCVVTYRAVDIRIPWIVYLSCLPWIKISHLDKARGVEWPFWQVRTWINISHMVSKTLYKITLLLSFNTYFGILQACLQQNLIVKRSSLSWYWNFHKHKARSLSY